MRGLFGVLLGGNLSASGSTGVPAGASAAPRPGWGGVWGGAMTNSTRRVTPDIALSLSTVYGAVNLLAKTLGSLPILMYRKDREGRLFEAPEHPLYELLQYQPNSWQTAFDFRAMLMSHLALRGNAFAEILPGPRGAVDRLEPLHPDRVAVDRLEDGTLRYAVSDDAKGVRYLLQDEVFHIRSPMTSANGLVGVSPVTYARETIGLALAAEEHGARMFGNGIRPSGVVQFPKGTKLSDVAFERLKADLKSQFGGLARVGGTPILEDGGEFKAVSLSADDVQFLGTRDFQIEEVCFVPGTEVLTEHGPRAIESIAVGDRVLTHKGRWRRVNHVMSRHYAGPMVTAQAKGLKPVTSTAAHPFLVQDMKPTRSHAIVADGDPQWRPASELFAAPRLAERRRSRRPHQSLLMPRLQGEGAVSSLDMARWAGPAAQADAAAVRFSGNHRATPVTRFPDVGYELGWLCGLFVADGSATDHQVTFYLGGHEVETSRLLATRLQLVFGVGCTTAATGNVARTVVSNAVLAAFFRQFGSAASAKRLPDWCMDTPPLRRGLLDGLVDGDGGHYRNDTYLRTTSHDLLWQVRLLNWAEGRNATVETQAAGRWEIAGRTGPSLESYAVRWRESPQARGCMGLSDGHVQFSLDEVTHSTYSGTVHNLEVEEDESYTTLGGVCHNCRWFDVPPVLLHHTTKTTSWGSGVEAIMIAFVRNNLKPWLAAWQHAIRRDLILAPGVYSARFDTEDLQRGDSAAMSNFYSRLVLNGILTRNEAREALGFNPLEHLDEPLVPTNTTTPDNMPQHVAPPALEGPPP